MRSKSIIKFIVDRSSIKIFIQVGLTGNENGQEEDYMSLDLVTEIASPDDEIEFEVLSHGVM